MHKTMKRCIFEEFYYPLARKHRTSVELARVCFARDLRAHEHICRQNVDMRSCSTIVGLSQFVPMSRHKYGKKTRLMFDPKGLYMGWNLRLCRDTMESLATWCISLELDCSFVQQRRTNNKGLIGG